MLMTGSMAVTGFWKTIAIASPRSERRSVAPSPRSDRPPRRTSPDTSPFAGSSPRAARKVTLFPEPDSPTIPTVSPAWTVRLTPRTAWTFGPPVRKATRRSSSSKRGEDMTL